MKLIRDVQNVLFFCLETAEKTLSETLPHVVAKIAEGRSKRMAALEKTATDRRRDIEQRSAETVTTSSAHLESFQTKAEKKLKEAEAEASMALTQLKESVRFGIVDL